MTLSMLFGGIAFAGSPKHTEPGTPGTKNGAGQTMAYLAQVGPSLDIAPGIGNLAREAELSVQAVKGHRRGVLRRAVAARTECATLAGSAR